ncbi:MAG: penicillin-binding protein 1B [Cardiobacteriaceae bacterium]|nr:penicillin-binding protein 1B [Cardiobacteriaceae bacterium]
MLRLFRNLFYFLVFVSVLGCVTLFMYAIKLEKQYKLDDQNLDGTLWSVPARVYARPLELYKGAALSADDLVNELQLLEYREKPTLTDVKQYHREGDVVEYYAQPFAFWDGARPARRMQVTFEKGKVVDVQNLSTLEEELLERLEPVHIASIYPASKQDRLLVNLEDVPPILVDSLIAIEDKNFWKHPGIDPRGLARAAYVTFIKKSGKQGASTLTQQFIKNHYLSSEQTAARKIKEVLMALVLEYHNNKKDILEGYLNEIYLGQDGQRAIHGFGLASEYYFNKELKDLGLHEVAMLIALVREPGNADPRRHPEYAINRRNMILGLMQQNGLISDADMKLAQSLPLDVVDAESRHDRVRFPAFVDLVYQQLNEHYKPEDLTKDGLNIFTTLDPQVQQKTQAALSGALPTLEKRNGLKQNFLQSSSVVVNTSNAEVLAVVGSRVPNEQGYNRAIYSKRNIGSVVKPMVYLAAVEYPQLYTLATLLDDSPLNYKMNGTTWSPKNYSKNNHGKVLLQDSLIHSYNIPTARIALDIGIKDVTGTMQRLGARENLPNYPAVSLGAVSMSALEVAQIYETFASGGYLIPLRSIREITTQDGTVISRFDLKAVKAIEPGPHYLIVSTMQQIPRRGTATAMKEKISPSLNIAGKTGTTDSYKDSWFAGFSGNLLTVVWVGNDQNKITKLTGGTGAMRVWMDIMKNLPNEPLELKKPESVVTRMVDKYSGALAGQGCAGRAVEIAFIAGSEPTRYQACAAPKPVEPDNDEGTGVFDNSGGLQWETIPVGGDGH